MKVKGNIIKIDQNVIVVELPDPNKGLGYIGYNDPDKETKLKKEHDLYLQRLKEISFHIGEVEIIQ